MAHDSNFALTESIITALKEKLVTIFAGKHLVFEVLVLMLLLFEKSSTSSKWLGFYAQTMRATKKNRAASTPCQLEVKRLKMAHNRKLEFEIDETVLEYRAGFKTR